MTNELINEATDILRKWLANEEIIDRTIDDDFTLMALPTSSPPPDEILPAW